MQPTLTIDLSSVKSNWIKLNSFSSSYVETSVVLKANAYGLGVKYIAPVLYAEGVRSFFVASVEEGIELRSILPENTVIYSLNGFSRSNISEIKHFNICPIINSPKQFIMFKDFLPTKPFAIQIDVGMNRLGFKAKEVDEHLIDLKSLNPMLIIGHLSSADSLNLEENNLQLNRFNKVVSYFDNVRKSIAASSGIMLGKNYHLSMTRPGIGLFGGISFEEAKPVIEIELPVIQIKEGCKGEGVGYNLTHKLKKRSTLATVASGYADGIMRSASNKGKLYYGGIECPILGRISMDLVTVDISRLKVSPEYLSLIGPSHSIIDLATEADTIPYEILTRLGSRYQRFYKDEQKEAKK